MKAGVFRKALLMLVAVLAVFLMSGCASTSANVSAHSGSAAQSSAASSEAASDAAPVTLSGQSGAAAPSTAGRLHVEGAQLVGEDGTPVQLRGVSTHGLAWFPAYVNDAFFGELRHDWGANVVRLALYTAEGGGYCTDGDKAALRKLVDDGVRYATDNDLYVIIDWHILSDNDPNMHVGESEAFFREVSAAYAGHDNVLYEICNEPNGATTWADVKAYAERVIPVIRANDPDSVIIVGTPTWSQDVDAAAADPLAAGNVMYALHFYAATHGDDLRAKAAAALDAGLPLFVTEFGICDASGNGAIDEAGADEWIALLDARGVSYVMWNLSNKAESSAMFMATCDKTSGFQDADLSQSGAWLKRTLANRTGGVASASAPSAASGASTSEPASAAASTVRTSGDFEYRAHERSSWDSDGKHFVLYDLTIVNTGEPVSGWEIDVAFNGDFELSDSWNGVFTPNGRTLRIGNAGYNGTVGAGGTVVDVGFIVSGKPGLGLQ